MSKLQNYGKRLKPIVDFVLSLLLLILFSPLFICISLVNLSRGLPVFFVHERPGYRGKSFRLFKFCTIHPRTGEISLVSHLLRKSSLDELPQLLNILKGEMSFVGPRPLLWEYMEQYTNEEKTRHNVKPGITGYAQVHGRNALTLGEKVAYDIYYVQNVSFVLDLKILVNTVFQLFKFGEADAHHIDHGSVSKKLVG